jgi:hypothetical protein
MLRPHKNKSVFIWIIVVIGLICLAFGSGMLFVQYESDMAQKDLSQEQPQWADLIQVSNPAPHDTVTSPLVVEGKARGPWYFEASFPVRLLDANGNELVVVPAQAQDSWMTEDFVPFKATLTFTKPTTATGTLILKNDNPSGTAENDKEIRIPVTF